MFKEILKIIPKLDPAALNDMEKRLSARFTKVAKKFGKGLGSALAGGGLAGLAVGLIDKLLNPLKETQDAIDRSIAAADDLVTNAQQFGTTAGKLLKLQQLGVSTGLDEESLFMLINKFQTAVAEAEADPTKKTSVRAFVGQQDMAEAFFGFIQALQKMEKNDQLRVQQEVFGEKQILKMADFLGTDFGRQLQLIGARPASAYDKSLTNLGSAKDATDVFTARRNLEDVEKKGRLVNAAMVQSRDQQLRTELDRENQRIASYQSLAKVSDASAKILYFVEKGFYQLTDLLTSFKAFNDTVKKLSTGRGWRGLFGSGE